ncbi:HEAT repeat-containing protein [Prescottella defluvii]|uniref:hypothetical protein n=1 Tax=Prescottella defluvii TaxID=1323361 RepID=UPI000AC7E1CB|nr:hypothetical protein [Prescottella defluvii]
MSDTYDWNRLFHAFDVAADTQAHLGALVDPDAAAFSTAMDHLYDAVLHQGTIYPATVPAVAAVAQAIPFWICDMDRETAATRLLALARFLDLAGGSLAREEASLAGRGEIVPPSDEEERWFFDAISSDDEEEVAQAWGSPVPSNLRSLAVPALRQQTSLILERLLELTGSGETASRAAAVGALGRWGGGATPPHRQRVTSALRSFADSATERDDRAAAVLALGTVGADVSDWLADADPAVRACAALHLPQSTSATAELVHALTRPEDIDGWFDRDRIPHSFHTGVRSTLLSSLLQRDTPFTAILPVAVAEAQISNPNMVDWAPLLRAAFPEAESTPGGHPPAPENIGAPQRQFLAALAENEQLWGTYYWTVGQALLRVGLPYDRQAVAALSEGTTGSR